jgi:hypothetical protein
MTQVTTFVQSGSPVAITPQSFTQNYAMPAYDASNLDVVVTYTGSTPAYLTFGSPPTAGQALLRGEIEVLPNGVPMLLTNNAATLAAAAANPLVLQSANSGAATSVSVVAGMAGGTLTIQRGTATSRLTF